jgi:glucan 1,3-beta-glucosidase
LAATVVAAIHVALGLFFDPRYKDFPFALLAGPIIALATLAASVNSRWQPGIAERVAAALLTGSALFIVANEGIANWQALLFGGLLVLLAFSCVRAKAAPD